MMTKKSKSKKSANTKSKQKKQRNFVKFDETVKQQDTALSIEI